MSHSYELEGWWKPSPSQSSQATQLLANYSTTFWLFSDASTSWQLRSHLCHPLHPRILKSNFPNTNSHYQSIRRPWEIPFLRWSSSIGTLRALRFLRISTSKPPFFPSFILLGSSAVTLSFNWTPLTPSHFKSSTPKGLMLEWILSTLLLSSSPAPLFWICPSALRCCWIPFWPFPLPRTHSLQWIQPPLVLCGQCPFQAHCLPAPLIVCNVRWTLAPCTVYIRTDRPCAFTNPQIQALFLGNQHNVWIED